MGECLIGADAGAAACAVADNSAVAGTTNEELSAALHGLHGRISTLLVRL